jgi:formaldehyde-activating enzyme involved in methanogenesis
MTRRKSKVSKPEMICDYVIHPAASIFPLMEGDRFQSLVDSIAEHGVQNPIVSREGEVLDGRNRLRAVMKLRDEGHTVDLPFVEWDSTCGLSATEWVAAQNLDRRHLSEDAYVAAQAALNRIIRKEAKSRQATSRFDSEKASKAAKARHAAHTKSGEPQKRDGKAEHARSTVGQLAAKTGASMHKAAQAVKLDQAVEAGLIPDDVQKDVIADKKKLRDAVKDVAAATKDVVPKKKRPAAGRQGDRKCESIDDEIRNAARRAWTNLRAKFATGDEHKKLRAVLLEIIRKEQQQFDDIRPRTKGSKKTAARAAAE